MPMVVLGVVILAGWGIYNVVQERARSRTVSQTAAVAYKAAEDAMKTALRSYERKQFEMAATNYTKVRQRYPTSVQAIEAWVMLPIAEAYLAMADGKWEDAVGKQNEASLRIKKIQTARSAEDPLYKWAQEAGDYVKNFRGYYLATRTFTEAMAKAETAFTGRQYEEVRLVLRKLSDDVTLTDGQEAQRKQFLANMDLTEFRGKLQGQIQKADDLLKQEKFLEAEEAYQAAQEMLQGGEASILPADEAKSVGGSIATKLGQLTSNRTWRDAEAAVEKARASGDKKALIDALRAWLRIQRDDKAKERINEEVSGLQSDICLAAGREHKKQGNIPKAYEEFRNALAHNPNNQEAKDELAMLDRTKEHASLVSVGDTKFAGAQWDEALAEYAKAAKLKLTDTLTAKMKECRFRIALAKADKLRMDGNFAEAAPAYEAARREKPSAAPLIDARLAAMRADETYRKLMEEALAALKKDQWPQARDRANQALKIRSTAEAKALVLETRYQENMARGKEALDQGDYNGALSYLKLARGFKDTEEIQNLIKQAEAKLKGG